MCDEHERREEFVRRWLFSVFAAGQDYQSLRAKNGRTPYETDEMRRLVGVVDEAEAAIITEIQET